MFDCYSQLTRVPVDVADHHANHPVHILRRDVKADLHKLKEDHASSGDTLRTVSASRKERDYSNGPDAHFIQ